MRSPGREQTGAVYKITVVRDDLGMNEHGAVINARRGLNTWTALTGNAGRRGHCGRRSDAR